MIRPTAAPRSIRTGAAAASVLGIVALAGCGASATADTESADAAVSNPAATATDAASPATTEAADDGSVYEDGTYIADGSYVDGGGTAETLSVTITLSDDVVTAVEVTGDAQSPQSQQYQTAFIGGIADVVEGKNIDDLSVSKVAGSSLTSGGFNDALEKIKAEAAA